MGLKFSKTEQKRRFLNRRKQRKRSEEKWHIKTRMVPRPAERKARMNEVGQIQTCNKSLRKLELGQLGQLFSIALVGLEDSTPPYKYTRRLGWNLALPKKKARTGEGDQVGQLQTCATDYETRNLANLANFFQSLGGPRRLDATLQIHKTTRVERCVSITLRHFCERN